jgi:hypothetical protein
MELSTKERQQGKCKNTGSARKVPAGRQRHARLVERLRGIIRLQAQQERQARQRAEQLAIEVELLRMRQREQCRATEQADQVRLFCEEANLPEHSFGARMITLCVNLSRHMSFRLIPKALKLIFDALGLSVPCPSHDTIEHWCKRIGLDQIHRPRQRHTDWLWIVDHSNQIGQEKVLVILGIPAARLPSPGRTLTLDQLEVLAIVPGKSWKRDDVRAVYEAVAQRCGSPRFVVCDGAVELRETVDVLEKPGQTVLVLRDFKHFAANRFEKLVGQSERFKSFCSAVGTTRCQVQQSEFAHLTPPSLKTKARFMNIAPLVRWASLILFLLENPDHDAVGDVDRTRLGDKFGWVESYRDEIASWARCCNLIDLSLGWVNTQGLNRHSSRQLDAFLDSSRRWDSNTLEGRLRSELIIFVGQSAAQLEEGERAWQSSEAIESVFGRYKSREFQHSRSGFTGLILSLPTLLRDWTPDQVRESLARVKNKEMRAWTQNNIGRTVSSRRAQAYRSFQKATKTTKTLKTAA